MEVGLIGSLYGVSSRWRSIRVSGFGFRASVLNLCLVHMPLARDLPLDDAPGLTDDDFKLQNLGPQH